MERQEDHDDGGYKFINVEIFKNQELGHGSYGAVYRAKCDSLPCAAKLIYPVLFGSNVSVSGGPPQGKEHRQPMRRFEAECRFLSQIKHPNIIQYLGVYREPDTNVPVLLMELMDDSLTHFLESSQAPLLFHLQLNILYDISLALAFLHTNGIHHRDMSSNNVLLIAGCRAKVTDFGMSTLTDAAASHLASLTQCPGTPAYMSPEALDEPPVYSEKLDCFSFGVLTIQVITQLFPKPTDKFENREVFDSLRPSRKFIAKVPVPEFERRQTHIDLISPEHPLLPTALNCIKDSDVERPTAEELCSTLEDLKSLPLYTAAIEQVRDHDRQLQTLRQTIQDKDLEIHEKDMHIQAMERQIDELNSSLEQQLMQPKLDGSLEERDQCILRQQEELQAMQQEIQKLRELKSLPLYTAAIEQVRDHDRQLQTLRQAIQDKDLEIHEKDMHIQAMERQIDELNSSLEQQLMQPKLDGSLEERDQCILRQQEELQAMQQEIQKLRELKSLPLYTAAIEQVRDHDRQLQTLRQAIQDKDLEIHEKDMHIQAMERQIDEQNSSLEQQLMQPKLDGSLEERDQCILRQQEELQAMQQEIQKLRELKSLPLYKATIEQVRDHDRQLQTLRQTIQDKDLEIHEKDMHIQAMERQIDEQNSNLEQQLMQPKLDGSLEERDQCILRQQEELQAMQQENQKLRELLKLKNQQIAELQDGKARNDKQIEDLLSQLQHLKLSQQQAPQLTQKTHSTEVKFSWQKGPNSPAKMYRGSSTVIGRVAYFNPWDSQDVYAFQDNNWTMLPQCPYKNSTLTSINDQLTAVGGMDPDSWYIITNKIYTHCTSDRTWVQQYPPMTVKRSRTTVLSTRTHVFVMGGESGGRKLTSTEVMNIQIKQWSRAHCLPFWVYQASTTLCGETLYLIGGATDSKSSYSVLSCRISELLSSMQPSTETQPPLPGAELWQRISELPVKFSTCVTIKDQLVVIGGTDKKDFKSSAVYKYSPDKNSWRAVSKINIARHSCLVAVLPDNILFVVGGSRPDCGGWTDETEITKIV